MFSIRCTMFCVTVFSRILTHLDSNAVAWVGGVKAVECCREPTLPVHPTHTPTSLLQRPEKAPCPRTEPWAERSPVPVRSTEVLLLLRKAGGRRGDHGLAAGPHNPERLVPPPRLLSKARGLNRSLESLPPIFSIRLERKTSTLKGETWHQKRLLSHAKY